MPRVIIERNYDYRPRRGLILVYKASPDPLVVSQGAADAIVAAGAGRIVERGETALPNTRKPRAPRAPRAAKNEPVAPADQPEMRESTAGDE